MYFADLITNVLENSNNYSDAVQKKIIISENRKPKMIKSIIHTKDKIIIRIGEK